MFHLFCRNRFSVCMRRAAHPARRWTKRLWLECLEDRTMLNAGALDSSFGTGGEVTTPFPGAQSAETAAVVIQPDGKIVVGGTVSTSSEVEIGLARYNADGSLDTTFGNGGLVTTPVGPIVGRPGTFPPVGAERIALQPDGKILVIGGKLARYTSSGSLDPAFGSSGLVSVAGPDLALLPDGKILVFGGPGLNRFNPDGSPDNTFGTGGQVSLNNGGSRLTLLPDGRFLLDVQRFNSDGSIDFSYAGSFVGFNTWDVALQANGRILAVGELTDPTTGQDFAVRRLNVNGTSDVTFGSGGLVTTPVPAGGFAKAVLPQPDGRIVAVGTNNGNGGSSIALVRYNPNGSLDATFGNGGETLTGGVNYASAVGALQPDGKIVAIASVFSANPPEFLVARYTADPPIADPNQRFLSQVYLDLLQRPLDPLGLSIWSNALAAGATRTQVVGAIESSQEYHAVEVQKLYGLLLERTAEPAGLNIWVGFLDQGGTFEQMEAMILGSDEYFAGHGHSTNDPFLSGLYGDVLNRPIDSAGSQNWSQALAGAASRTSIAVGVLGSSESDTDEVQALYRQLLRRAADSSGLHAFTQALQQGVPNEAIIALIAGSDEYFGRL